MDIKALPASQVETRSPSKKTGRKRVETVARKKPVKISIIIPAHNEQAYLRQTLLALKRQKYPDHEVIVVANGCSDQTAEVAQELCHRLIVLSQKSLGVARNLGARMASGDLLLFLDADTLLEPAALNTIAEKFSPRDAAGTVQGKPDMNRFAYRFMYLLKNSFHRFKLHSGSSGVILCWRKHFIRLGGFDEHMEVRENSELIRRLKQFGSYRYIGQTAATTSMRRYHRRGFWRMAWLWTRLWIESHFVDTRQRQYEIVR